VGLVGYFRPVLPEPASVPEGQWDRVLSRFNQRSTEFRELAASMAAYEAENRFAVKDGVVHGVDEDGAQRPLTGDHDVFDVSTPNGTRVTHPRHDALIEEMRSKDIAVMHGAHMFWNPSTAFDKSVFDKIVDSHQGPDGEPLLRFRPDNEHAELTWPASPRTTPAPDRPTSPADDLTLFSKVPAAPGPADTVRADGATFQRLDTPGGGNSLFRALLDAARSRPVPPAWAARDIAGLRRLLRDRITGSELAAAAAEATPDPVLAVVDDLRMDALDGVRDPDEHERITQQWNAIAQAVVTDGDAGRWQRILRDSAYPHLADVAPTPAAARRLGTEGLMAAAAELPGLWASPFGDLLPQALAHTLDVDLRLVQPDGQAAGDTLVVPLHPGGRDGTLHLAYNGTDHYDALIPAPDTPATPTTGPETGDSDTTTTTPTTTGTTPTPATQGPDGSDPFREWLRDMGGITDVYGSGTPDPSDPYPLETQLERYRPARLLTGPDARPPGPAPRTVTFDDGSRLPAVLLDPDADPRDGDERDAGRRDGDPHGGGPDGRTDRGPQTAPSGLFTGLGVVTLRSPEQVAREILGKLPETLRGQFDEAELLRLLTEQPGAFTAPHGVWWAGRSPGWGTS
jgi:hypothetical protein